MRSTESTAQKALAISLGLFLFAQLIVGGNTADVILFTAGWAVVVLLIAAYAYYAQRLSLHRTHSIHRLGASGSLIAALIGLSLLAISGVVGLVALDTETWLALPGHDFYAGAEQTLRKVLGGTPTLAISLDPAGTVRSLLVLVPALAILVAVSVLKRDLLLMLLGLSVIFALIQAVIGIVQIGFGTPSLLSADGTAGGHVAKGTFISKNSYATLLAMHLPLVLVRAAGQFTFFRSDAEPSTLSTFWWGIAAAIIATALVASLSRAGSTAGFVVALVALAVCGSRQQPHTRRVVFVVVILLAVLLAWLSSLDRLLASMTGTAVSESALGRQWLTDKSFAAAKSFWPLGAGLGSYAIAIQRFQTAEFIGFIEYAHNDYAQLIFETGAVGVVVLICFAIAGAWVVIGLLKRGITATRVSPAVGCFLGAAAFAIHAWFDFPAHIPGIVFAVCLLFAASTNGLLVDLRERHAPSRIDRDSMQAPTHGRRKAHGGREDTTAPITVQPNPWITRPGEVDKT